MSEVHPDPSTMKSQTDGTTSSPASATTTTTPTEPATAAPAPAPAASSYLGGWVSWAQQTIPTLIEKAQTIDPNQVKARASDILVKAQDKASVILVKAQDQAATLVDKAQHLNANQVRHYMSGALVRYQQDGYDLDLVYITDQIIVMGLPSEGVEAMYRNPIDEVVRFFQSKHSMRNIKIFNLCNERAYNYEKFNNQVAEFRIKDQDVCALKVINQFCVSASSWISSDPNHVVAIHCNAGTGRSGMMACCLMQYLRCVPSADEAIRQLIMKRTGSDSTSPTDIMNASQLRYVRYFGDALAQGVAANIPSPTVFINEIEIGPVIGGAYPALVISNSGTTVAHIRDPDCVVGEESGLVLQLAGVGLTGDVTLTFMDMGVLYDAEMLSIHFHTHFLGTSGVSRFVRDECSIPGGEKALRRFSEAFVIEMRWSTQRIVTSKRATKTAPLPAATDNTTQPAATPSSTSTNRPPQSQAVNSLDATHEISLDEPSSTEAQQQQQQGTFSVNSSGAVPDLVSNTTGAVVAAQQMSDEQQHAATPASTTSTSQPPFTSSAPPVASTQPVPELTTPFAQQQTQMLHESSSNTDILADVSDLLDQNLDLDLTPMDDNVFKSGDLDDIDALVGDVLGNWVDDSGNK